VEGSAVSLGPTALAARERLLANLPGPGARVGAERERAGGLGVSRSAIRAALGDLERGGVIRRTRGRGGGIFVAKRKVERDLTTLAGLPAYPRRGGFQPAPLPAPRRLPVRRAGALDRHRGGRRRRARGAGAAAGSAGARGRSRAPGRWRAAIARARALPRRALPGPARPLAGRLAVRAPAGRLRARA